MCIYVYMHVWVCASISKYVCMRVCVYIYECTDTLPCIYMKEENSTEMCLACKHSRECGLGKSIFRGRFLPWSWSNPLESCLPQDCVLPWLQQVPLGQRSREEITVFVPELQAVFQRLTSFPWNQKKWRASEIFGLYWMGCRTMLHAVQDSLHNSWICCSLHLPAFLWISDIST